MTKVLFISSTGGHLNELMQLDFEKYDYTIVTEKTDSDKDLKDKYKNKVYYLAYGTRKTKPKVIVTTGTHTAVPMCYIAKLFGAKIIWIETFANRNTKTLAGRLVYPIATTFVVQWEEMKKLYPKAEYWGWIY